MRFATALLSSIAIAASAAVAQEFTIHTSEVDDRKAVIATVEPVHMLVARARIGGTIIRVNVREGYCIAAGAEVVTVVDEKLALQMQALDFAHQIATGDARSGQNRFRPRKQELMCRRRQFADAARPGPHRPRRRRADAGGHALRSRRHHAAGGRRRVLAPGAGRVLTVPGLRGTRRSAGRDHRNARRRQLDSCGFPCPQPACPLHAGRRQGADRRAGRPDGGRGRPCKKARCASSIPRFRAAG